MRLFGHYYVSWLRILEYMKQSSEILLNIDKMGLKTIEMNKYCKSMMLMYTHFKIQ